MKKDFFKKAEEKIEEHKSRRFGEAGFVLGAVAAMDNENASVGDVVAGGVVGYLAAGLFEFLFPKTANVVKTVL